MAIGVHEMKSTTSKPPFLEDEEVMIMLFIVYSCNGISVLK
jgi:hypothetical protein